MGLVGSMVGVLAKDNDLNAVKRSGIKSVENKLWGRVDGGGVVLFLYKISESFEIRFFELGGKDFFPRGFDADIH